MWEVYQSFSGPIFIIDISTKCSWAREFDEEQSTLQFFENWYYFQCSYQKFCECVYDHKLVNRNKRCNFKFWEKAMQLLILCKVKTKYIERFLSYEVFWKKLFVIIRGNSSKGGPPSFVSNIKWIRACLLTCNSADIIKKP